MPRYQQISRRKVALRRIRSHPAAMRPMLMPAYRARNRVMKTKFVRFARAFTGLVRRAKDKRFVDNYRRKHDTLAMRAYQTKFRRRARASVVRSYPNIN